MLVCVSVCVCVCVCVCDSDSAQHASRLGLVYHEPSLHKLVGLLAHKKYGAPIKAVGSPSGTQLLDVEP